MCYNGFVQLARFLGARRTMRPRHAVLLTEHAAKHAHPERASRAEGSLLAASLPIPAHPTQLLSRQHIVRVSSLDATLMSSLVNGAIKGLKTWGWGPFLPVLKLIPPHRPPSSALFLFMHLRIAHFATPLFSHTCM